MMTRVGHGWSELLPVFDFETYSAAGLLWDLLAQRWLPAPGLTAHNRGLSGVGVHNYVNHPSFEVICLAYDLKEGAGVRFWKPGVPDPMDLLEYVRSRRLISAFNVGFERTVWNDYCVRAYGWPPLDPLQLRCDMAKARAWSLPGSLANVGVALSLTQQKDASGSALIRKLTMPKNPTKKSPALQWTPETAPEDFAAFYAYNVQDVLAEAEASSRIPDLCPRELAIWQLDQKINTRGMRIDTKAVADGIEIIEQCTQKYTGRLRAITQGAVSNHSEVAKTLDWLHTQGVHLPTLDEDVVVEQLKLEHSAGVREVLEIRQKLAFSSVKKLYAMRAQTCADGRLRNQYVYHGAHTGLWNGQGVQVVNLYKGKLNTPAAVETALAAIASGSLEYLEATHGDALETVADCLRSMIIASHGHRLIMSDYSAIQAVVTAALAGEEWRMEVFRTHGKIYEVCAAKITGKTLQYYIDYKKEHGKHHEDRQPYGKIAELSCFTAETKVLTQRGYVDMVDVSSTDKLWDGVEWVLSDGSIRKGARSVISLDGVGITPNHPISLGNSWTEAKTLSSDPCIFRLALAIGSASLPYSAQGVAQRAHEQRFNARAACRRMKSIVRLYGEVLRHVATSVQNGSRWILRGYASMVAMRSFCPTTATGAGYLGVSTRQSIDAITRKTPPFIITGGGVSAWTILGGRVAGRFLSMCSLFRDGTSRAWRWTASRLMGTMSQEISDSRLNRQTAITSEECPSFSAASASLRSVYDIVNAGPRNRFTIRTNSGHLLVHNSGFGGWIGAWKRFGASDFMSDPKIKQALLKWRADSPAIVELWGGQVRDKFQRSERAELYGLEGAAVSAVLKPGDCFGYRGIRYVVHEDVLYCQPPGDGAPLCYHEPRLAPSQREYARSWELELSYMTHSFEQGWHRDKLYGGVLTQNVVSKVAREFQADAMMALEGAGYPVVGHTHDEIVCDVPDGFGSVPEFLSIVNRAKSWAVDDQGCPWPVKAPGAEEEQRYGKWET